MIEKKYAVEQIKRFKILNFFPSDSVGLNELAMALMVSDTEQIAKQVVDDLMTEFVDCPKPAQIRIAAYARNEAVERASAPKTPEDQWGPIGPLCGLCASWGWVVRDNVASRCTCQNGQALDQKLMDLLNERLRNPHPKGHERLRMRRVSEENLLGIVGAKR